MKVGGGDDAIEASGLRGGVNEDVRSSEPFCIGLPRESADSSTRLRLVVERHLSGVRETIPERPTRQVAPDECDSCHTSEGPLEQGNRNVDLAGYESRSLFG